MYFVLHFYLQILEDKRPYLCKSLNPEDHFNFLRSKSILTKDDQDVIRNEVTRTAKAGKLLDILLTKGPKAYEMLVFSIHRNRTQNFLVEMLNKEFENRKNSYIGKLYNTNLYNILHSLFLCILKACNLPQSTLVCGNGMDRASIFLRSGRVFEIIWCNSKSISKIRLICIIIN